ncbi:hypothetical protein GCM10009841_14850 [Microlunatus panaciterrae]
MGLLFGLLVIALVGCAIASPGLELVRVVMALLSPAAAAWVTQPAGPMLPSTLQAPAWVVRGLALLLVLSLAPISTVALDLRTADNREQAYLREGVTPVGLADDRGWSYGTVIESVVARGFSYQVEDPEGRALRVEVTQIDDSVVQPPRNCSPDPNLAVRCEDQGNGVFCSVADSRQRIVVRGEGVVLLWAQSGAFTDGELDRLAGGLRPRSARWLAERQCPVCRLLPD